ncbi:MAG TPA: Dabb family protein [Burkholderiaceae bacterium]|nr:Dabb family protein [Burkholderiaceae bacterium]
MIRHVVMWELHDPANAESFRNALLPCAHLVEGQRGFEVALRSAKLPASAHVCLIATFDDADALKRYQEHPVHQAVSERIGPLRKARHLLDYELSDEAHTVEAAELSLVV